MAALQVLLAWPEISRSPQLGRFLDYIVRQTLDGNGQAIKAYAIAVDVFGRPADFDPQADPIVRVQARRLRGLLDEYYSGPGMDETIQIRLPVGRYVPEFVPAGSVPETGGEPESPRTPRGLPRSWFVLALLAVAIAMGAYGHNAWFAHRAAPPPRAAGLYPPSITIVEFQDLAGNARLRPQVAGLAVELVTDLEQFGTIEVRYAASGEAPAVATATPATDFVLTGIVRLDEASAQYSAILTDSDAGAVVWNHTLALPLAEAAELGVLDRVSQVFSLMLGSPRGPLHAPARQLLAEQGPPEAATSPYLCRVLFDFYRETGSASMGQRAGACFLALGGEAAGNGGVQAGLASLTARGHVPAAGRDDAAPDERLDAAEALMVEAVRLAPVSGFVWEQRARLYAAQGLQRQARDAYSSAVQLNPANADTLAGFALLLALEGNLAEAEPLSRQTLDESAHPPAWYYGVPTLLALRRGDYEAAMADAEIYAGADRELGPILAILAGQGGGDSAMVNRYLPQVLDVGAFRAQGVVPRLSERIGDRVLIEAIRSALSGAGMPPLALARPF